MSDLSTRKIIDWALDAEPTGSTIAVTLATLSGCLNVCRLSLFQEVPHPQAPQEAIQALRQLGRIAPRHPTRITRITDDAIAHIAAEWRSNIPTAALWILVDTCMRSGELCRLTWDDCDLERRLLIVRNRKHPIRRMGNDEVIPMLGRSAPLLATLRRTGLPRPCPYQQNSLSDAFRKARTRAGYSFRLHDLRHEGISRRADRGWTPQQIAAVSGHHDLRTLSIYTHVSPERLLELDMLPN